MSSCHNKLTTSTTQNKTKMVCLSRQSFFVAIGLCLVLFVSAELQRFVEPPKSDGSISFLVIGDWGRKGAYNQSQVAFQMGKVGEELDIDFVVSTGDNFYDNGLSSEHDTAFEESFSNIYTADSLQKQWYSVLGNHDYRGDAEAQLSPVLTQIDSRWVCLRSFILDTEVAEIFFVDTTPFVKEYYNTEEHTYDWRAIPSRHKYMAQVLNDLELALKKSTAKWKIVVGHHAIRSISHHGDTHELVQHLLPILQAYNVDYYINGHDHCLQRITDTHSRIQFLTSGAGSKAWRGDIKETNRDGVKLFYDGQGFMSVKLTPSHSQISFYDVAGNNLHTFFSSSQFHFSS